MVNNSVLRKVAEPDCEISIEIDGAGAPRRIITNGPIYDLLVAKDQLASLEVKFVTEKTLALNFNTGMDERELRNFIRALIKDKYKKSERCTTSRRVTRVEYDIDCDAYAMRWNREEQRSNSRAKSFYLKFGFSECDSGCLVVSFHD